MSILLTLTHDEKVINFKNDEYEVYGVTNFKKEFFDELIQVNWYVDEKNSFRMKKHIFTQDQVDLAEEKHYIKL